MHLETYIHAHILGGLFGQALGDAWAMPAYLRPEQTWTYYDGWLKSMVDAPPDHPVHAGLKAGQITDDTQQAIALSRAIIAEGKISVTGAAQAIVTWYDQIDGDNTPFVGPSTRRAVAALKAGQDPYQTGLQGDTNGAVMRSCPIGLIHPGAPEEVIEDVVLACTPTHFTDVAISGACAVATAIAQAMTPNTTLEEIIETAIWGADMGLRYGQPWMGASVARKIDSAVQLVSNVNLPEQERLRNLYDLIGATMAVPDSVPCAFGILTLAQGNPVDCAIYAAALSGDADTVGAIACAIAGTWQTVNAIPLEHIETLRQANPQYNFEEIAEGLYDVAIANYADAEADTGDEAFNLRNFLGQNGNQDDQP